MTNVARTLRLVKHGFLAGAAFGLILCFALSCDAARRDPRLVAWYTFDEGPSEAQKEVKDHSGRGNHGRNLGATYVNLGEGKGYALRFDTPKAQVDCGAGRSLDLTGEITIELWLYPETRPRKGQPGLVGKSLGSYLLRYAGSCWFSIAGPSSRRDASAGAPVGEWTHIVATFDGKQVKAYSNGRLQNAVRTEFKKINHGGNLYLRYPTVYGGMPEPTFKCMMDDVRIYRRALSEKEVMTHYRNEAAARGMEDVALLEQVRLISHVRPAYDTLVVEADFILMKAGALKQPEAVLNLELRDVATQEIVAQHGTADLPKSGVFDWTVDTADLPAGEYEVRAVFEDKEDAQIGVPSSAQLTISHERPAWLAAYDGAKILNNFVAELLRVRPSQSDAQQEYTFTNPREGWVFVRAAAPGADDDKVFLSIDAPADEANAVLLRAGEAPDTLEGMRHLAAGPHKVHVRCQGAAHVSELVVRAVPELMYNELGYNNDVPWTASYGPYDWDFLERIGLLSNVNAILERHPSGANAAHLKEWRRQGKKALAHQPITKLTSKHPTVTPEAAAGVWTGSRGFQSADYDGVMIDELSAGDFVTEYPSFTEAIRRIAAKAEFTGKSIYPYCHSMYGNERSTAFVSALRDAGYKWAEQVYLVERADEREATAYLNEKLRLNMLRYQDIFPDVAKDMIMCLACFSAPPESVNVYPSADFKVFMDMQMNLLANDPAFFGLCGVIWYHSAYTDEEIMRWVAKLYRHYCIEGKRERLFDSPYLLSHVRNADFEEGASSWTLEPADEESISFKEALGYGLLQGRYAKGSVGNRFLVTKRRAEKPNRFSQTIENLEPGGLYSLKMFVADYGELTSGKSENRAHHVNVRIEGAQVIPEKSFQEVFPSGLCGQSFGPFNRQNNLFITYRVIVFRAAGESARLVVSDWATDDDPGGPIGQELAFNFMEIQPYLEN